MRDYYDYEWGTPVTDQRGVFERIYLEAFQAGMSWVTILRKHPASRQALDAYNPAAIATYDHHHLARLLADENIVRNQRKIDAVIGNARATLKLQEPVSETKSPAVFRRQGSYLAI